MIHLSDEDRALIEGVTGQPLGDISGWELGSPKWGVGAKFIDNPADNKRGHHLVRCVCAGRAYEERLKDFGSYNDTKVQEFLKVGFVTERVKVEAIPETVKKYVGTHKFEDNPGNPKVPVRFKKTGSQWLYQTIIHDPSDQRHKKYLQYALHSDIFFPSFKFWYVFEKVKKSHGPFTMVPESHDISEKRLSWDYAASQLPPHMLCVEGNPSHGSFRVHNSAIEGKESKELAKYGFKEPVPLTAAVGTLIISNVRGFHKRGRAEKGTKRRYILTSYRPLNPFRMEV